MTNTQGKRLRLTDFEIYEKKRKAVKEKKGKNVKNLREPELYNAEMKEK